MMQNTHDVESVVQEYYRATTSIIYSQCLHCLGHKAIGNEQHLVVSCSLVLQTTERLYEPNNLFLTYGFFIAFDLLPVLNSW